MVLNEVRKVPIWYCMSRFYLYLRLPVLYGCDYTDISVLCSIKLVLISVNLVITKRLKLAMWFFFSHRHFYTCIAVNSSNQHRYVSAQQKVLYWYRSTLYSFLVFKFWWFLNIYSLVHCKFNQFLNMLKREVLNYFMFL